MDVRTWLVVAASVVLVLADDAQDEMVSTDISLGEFDLEDQCDKKADTEWTFITGTGPPAKTLQNKVKEEETYGDTWRALAKEVAPHLKLQLSNSELIRKLHLITTAGDVLLHKKQYHKEVKFSNELDQIRRGHNGCATEPCQQTPEGAEHILQSSLDADKLFVEWTRYHNKFSSKIEEFSEILHFTRSAAKANGAKSVEAYWQQQLSEFPGGYSKAVSLWRKIEPLYEKLHTFVHKQLSKQYAVFNSMNETLIPAHFLGSVSGIDWTGVSDHVLYSSFYQDLLSSLNKKMLGGVKMYIAADNMTASLGLETLPAYVWKESWFNSSCPADIVGYCQDNKLRVATCNKTGWSEYLDAYETVMRVKHWQLAAEENSLIMRENIKFSALHEAMAGLSTLLATTPVYLQHLGLLNQQEMPEHATASLALLAALRTLPQLPYYLAADLWRVEAINNNITNSSELYISWKKFRADMQKVSLPLEDENVFDFLSDSYITSNKPYLGKFCGAILQFQLLEIVLSDIDMDYMEVEMDEVFTQKEELKKLLQEGNSRSWRELVEQMVGIEKLDSGPLLKYFQKLETHLEELEQLEPIISRRFIVKQTTSPPVKTAKVQIIMTTTENIALNITSENTTDITENEKEIISTKVGNEQSEKSGNGTLILFTCTALVAVVLVIAFFLIGRNRFVRKHFYRRPATQDI